MGKSTISMAIFNSKLLVYQIQYIYNAMLLTSFQFVLDVVLLTFPSNFQGRFDATLLWLS